MRVLLTRLAGKRVALHQFSSGFGPTLWIGEFRDNHSRPIGMHQRYGERYIPMVVSSPSLAGTLDGLQRLTKDWVFPC